MRLPRERRTLRRGGRAVVIREVLNARGLTLVWSEKPGPLTLAVLSGVSWSEDRRAGQSQSRDQREDEEHAPVDPNQRPAVPRSSECPAFTRGHWTMGRPSVRYGCPSHR